MAGMKQFSFAPLKKELIDAMNNRRVTVLGLDGLTQAAMSINKAEGFGLSKAQITAFITSFGDEILGSFAPSSEEDVSIRSARAGQLGGPKEAFVPLKTFMGNSTMGNVLRDSDFEID